MAVGLVTGLANIGDDVLCKTGEFIVVGFLIGGVVAPSNSEMDGAVPLGVTGELGVEEEVFLGVPGDEGADVVGAGGMVNDGNFRRGEHNP